MTGPVSSDGEAQQDDAVLASFSEGETSIPPADEFLDQMLETKEGAALADNDQE
ncbi:hypothetical protein [Marinimicrobium sp. ABcell2]|uniref:hypothetical protein n=1 Tax=Marinimicrobium sp. ABcell2 TaxID=3069751 RepID=UPI0027B4877B|nr:hypothetical protein [Marinimicrobium sp. ABcell2]MDQ2077529.1 hypothetical protein [Marinimicrobium sp. ABcell2]